MRLDRGGHRRGGLLPLPVPERAARGAACVRVADDRGGREREGAIDYMGHAAISITLDAARLPSRDHGHTPVPALPRPSSHACSPRSARAGLATYTPHLTSSDVNYTLEKHGDDYEQRYWAAFLRDEFPAYEVVWASYIVPLTGRPEHVYFKTDDELAEIGRGPSDVANAQLHYTTFTHLVRVFELRRTEFESTDLFIEAMVRLAAATDVADELFERVTKPACYEPWKESRAPRDAWRKANGYPLREVREYRNRLLHGRLLPFVQTTIVGSLPGEIFVPGRVRNTIQFPKIGREANYVDWRWLLTGDDRIAGEALDADFDLAATVVDDAWNRLLGYLEREWERTLVPRLA